MLRAYAKYLRQAGSTFSQDYVEQCLVANVRDRPAAGAPVRGALRPATPAAPEAGSCGDAAETAAEAEAALATEITAALDDVASLDHDRILRSLLALVTATVRTNFFQVGRGRASPSGTSRSSSTRRGCPSCPSRGRRTRSGSTRPRVEGVHLRFGAVARGGLRWSDRREDFRTEVLGLVKAQMVKNAVIVPTGAKGGFVAKQLPDPAVDRDAWLAEGVR